MKCVDAQHLGTLIKVGNESSQVLQTQFYVVFEVEGRRGGGGECEPRVAVFDDADPTQAKGRWFAEETGQLSEGDTLVVSGVKASRSKQPLYEGV